MVYFISNNIFYFTQLNISQLNESITTKVNDRHALRVTGSHLAFSRVLNYFLCPLPTRVTTLRKQCSLSFKHTSCNNIYFTYCFGTYLYL